MPNVPSCKIGGRNGVAAHPRFLGGIDLSRPVGPLAAMAYLYDFRGKPDKAWATAVNSG